MFGSSHDLLLFWAFIFLPNIYTETIRLNNPRKYIKNPHAIEACENFNNWNHVFHKHGKFILIEQLSNIKNTSTEAIKQKRKDRENYWIKNL